VSTSRKEYKSNIIDMPKKILLKTELVEKNPDQLEEKGGSKEMDL